MSLFFSEHLLEDLILISLPLLTCYYEKLNWRDELDFQQILLQHKWHNQLRYLGWTNELVPNCTKLSGNFSLNTAADLV